MVQVLLTAGADVRAACAHGQTALHVAVTCNHADCIAPLLAAGISFTLRCSRGHNAADLGACSGSVQALETLLTSDTWRALSTEARLEAELRLFGYVQDVPTLNVVVKCALNVPAMARFCDNSRDNALHHVAAQGKAVPLICALIKQGVDPTARNSHGQIPADVAQQRGHALQATLLSRAAEDAR